jgi:4-hydroxy-4-methyl-2-oxoglutarate aldolase
VVPLANAADVAKAGEQRVAKEAKTRERLAKGEVGLDIYGLRAKLKELGVEYVEELVEETAANGRVVVKG